MDKQISIFDILYPDRINPIREVAKRAGPYWTTSRERIELVQDSDIEEVTKVVKQEYCPYGYSGFYGGGVDNPNTLRSYDMKTNCIRVEWIDEEARKQQRDYSWEDFAREVMDLIWSGEYKY